MVNMSIVVIIDYSKVVKGLKSGDVKMIHLIASRATHLKHMSQIESFPHPRHPFICSNDEQGMSNHLRNA